MLREATIKYGSEMAVFEAWQDKYKSPVLGLKFGNQLAIVVLTHEVIHEVHSNEVFDGRPDNYFIRLRSFNSRFINGEVFAF